MDDKMAQKGVVATSSQVKKIVLPPDASENEKDAKGRVAKTMELFREKAANLIEETNKANMVIAIHILEKYFDNDPKRIEDNKFHPHKAQAWKLLKDEHDWPWKSDTGMRNLLRGAVQKVQVMEKNCDVEQYTKVTWTHLTMLLRVADIDKKIELLNAIQNYDGTYTTAMLNAEINKYNKKPSKPLPSTVLGTLEPIRQLLDMNNGTFNEDFLNVLVQIKDNPKQIAETKKEGLKGVIDAAILQLRNFVDDLRDARRVITLKKGAPTHDAKPVPGQAI